MDWMPISGISARRLCHFWTISRQEILLICLDEPARLKEKGETVEQEFRESMIHRLEKGYLLPGQTELLYAGDAGPCKASKPLYCDAYRS